MIITVAICLLPLPKNTNITYAGYEIDSNGAILSLQQINIQATRYCYLLKEDVWHFFSMEIDGVIYDTSSYTEDLPIFVPHPMQNELLIFHSFDTQESLPLVCSVANDSDATWYCVHLQFKNRERFFVFSSKKDFDPKEIWDLSGIV